MENYGTTYHIGESSRSKTAPTAKTASTVDRVYPMDGTTKGRQRGGKGQTKARADQHVADGFLKITFMPKLLEAPTENKHAQPTKTERDFYQSLSQLGEYFDVDPKPTSAFDYPYNIALAISNVAELLENKVSDLVGMAVISEGNVTSFEITQRYDTGRTLYYIPVVPLYTMLRNKKRKHCAKLLLSVCSYLYHGADIAYYRQESSYLWEMYELMSEWENCDDENDGAYAKEHSIARGIGDLMEQKLFNLRNLDLFGARLEGFKCRDDFDRDCLKLAGEAFELFTKYPKERIYRNAFPYMDNESQDGEVDGYGDEYPISTEMYVSFCAENKGLVFDNLYEMINCEFNERVNMEEPTIIKRFDGNNILHEDLDFERRLFTVIDELIYLLNNFN